MVHFALELFKLSSTPIIGINKQQNIARQDIKINITAIKLLQETTLLMSLVAAVWHMMTQDNVKNRKTVSNLLTGVVNNVIAVRCTHQQRHCLSRQQLSVKHTSSDHTFNIA